MPKSRMEARDTVEIAHHALSKLLAEGWVVESVEQHFELKHRLPVEATLTVRLVPFK